MSTFSVFCHVLQIHASNKDLAAVNIGELRAESMLDFKRNALVGHAMVRLACQESMLMPRPVNAA